MIVLRNRLYSEGKIKGKHVKNVLTDSTSDWQLFGERAVPKIPENADPETAKRIREKFKWGPEAHGANSTEAIAKRWTRKQLKEGNISIGPKGELVNLHPALDKSGFLPPRLKKGKNIVGGVGERVLNIGSKVGRKVAMKK